MKQRERTSEERIGVWRRAHQKPAVLRTLKAVAWVLTILSGISALFAVFLYTPYLLWSICGLVFTLLPILAVLLFPAYFSLMEAPWLKEVRQYADNVWLLPMLMLGGTQLTVHFIRNGSEVVLVPTVFLVVGLFVAVLTALCFLRVPEFRARCSTLYVAVMFFFLSIFTACVPVELNYILPPRTVCEKTVEITELLETHSARYGVEYCCRMAVGEDDMPDTAQLTWKEYSSMEVGDPVVMIVSDGPLGMTYVEWAFPESE